MYHSRGFVARLAASAALVVVGAVWLLVGLKVLVGVVAVGAGALAIVRLVADRWAVDHGREPLRDWRPSRRVYLLPLGLCVAGVLLAVLVPGHTNPLIGLGLALTSVSVPLAIAIAIRRAMTNTEL